MEKLESAQTSANVTRLLRSVHHSRKNTPNKDLLMYVLRSGGSLSTLIFSFSMTISRSFLPFTIRSCAIINASIPHLYVRKFLMEKKYIFVELELCDIY